MTASQAGQTASATADVTIRSGRVLVAGVGYSNLRDLSLGPVLVERLRRRHWPASVQIEDMSYGAVAALHWLQLADSLSGAVFVTSTARGDDPGVVRTYDLADRPHPTPDEVQVRITEAVTGIISLDGLLAVTRHFGALPERVRIVEVEPADESWGDGFSAELTDRLGLIEATIGQQVQDLLR